MRRCKRIISICLLIALVLGIIPQTIFASTHIQVKTPDYIVSDISDIKTVDEIYQKSEVTALEFQFHFQVNKQGVYIKAGDQIEVPTNLGQLFDTDWSLYDQELPIYDSQNQLLATAKVSAEQIVFTIAEGIESTDISGSFMINEKMIAKDVGATPDTPVTKSLIIGNAQHDIVFKEKKPSTGEGNTYIGPVDIDYFWKNAYGNTLKTGAAITMEVNPIGSMDLYGYLDRMADETITDKRKPIIHDTFIVKDEIPEKGYVDLESVKIYAVVPTYTSWTETKDFNGWYHVPAGIHYAGRSGSIRHRIDSTEDKGQKRLTYLTQYDDESYSEFEQRIQSTSLSWGVYQSEDKTQTFLCNFGRIGDPNHNNGIMYEDFGYPECVSEHPEIFGEKGPTGGNIVSYYIEFNTYYPDIVGQKKVKNYASRTSYQNGSSNPTTSGNWSGEYLIDNNLGGGVGVARKNELILKLVDEDDSSIVIPDAEFKIQMKENGQWEDTIFKGKTDENGLLNFGPMLDGEYRIVQTSSQDGYYFDNHTYGESGNDLSKNVNKDGTFTITSTDRFGFGTVATNSKNKYQLDYAFKSVTPGYQLPEEVMKLLPEGKTIRHGDTVTPDTLTFDSVSVESGTWVFKQWMPDKVENVQDDVVLTGEWEFKPHQYKVHYQFKADDGSKLPEEVMKQLPSSTTVDYGENVKPGKHQLTKVSDAQGVYVFEKWTPEEYRNVKGEVTFTGIWKYYEYTYVDALDLVVYEGGLGSHQNQETGDALPEPEWTTDFASSKIIVGEDKWDYKTQGLPFDWEYRYLDDDKAGQKVDESALAGVYGLYIFEKEGYENQLVQIDGKYLYLTNQGQCISQVSVRDVTNNDAADTLSSDYFKPVYGTSTNQMQKSLSLLRSALNGHFSSNGTLTGECDLTQPHGHVEANTIFYKNGKTNIPVNDDAMIGLLWDDLLSDVLGSDERMDSLHQKSLDVVPTLDLNAPVHYQFQYVDLVDMSDGNIWVGTPNQSVTVYWPYPEGVNKNDDISLTYFDKLTRDYTVDMSKSDLDNEIAQSKAHALDIVKTDTGILFEVPALQFGPFELMWQKNYHVQYEFESSSSKDLPHEILAQLPVDKNVYKEGSYAKAIDIEKKVIQTDEGTWTFEGWDENQKQMNDDVIFTGIWTFDLRQMTINEVPVINGNDQTIHVGESFDPMKNVTAQDKEDGDLTEDIQVIENTVNTKVPGIYHVTYKVIDSDGALSTKTVKITVLEDTTNDASKDVDSNQDNHMNETVESIQTGDPSLIGLYSLLLIICGGIVLYSVKRHIHK